MSSTRVTLEDKLRALPKRPGVYLFKDVKGNVIYVGKARVLRNRVRQYFQKAHDGRYQFELLVKRISDVEVITTDTELEALILENNLVRQQKPRYNIDLRDDKSFPYLRVSNEPFPRIFLTRQPVLDGSKYFGPYSDLYHLKGLLRVLRGMLKIRTCNLPLTEEAIRQGKFKACLEHDIGRCNAPCVANENRAEYDRRIRDFIDVANGRGLSVIARLQEELSRLSDDLKFEEAAQLRDWLAALDNLTQRQKIISPEPINRDVFGVAVEDNWGSAVIFQVRGGRMVGRLDYRLDNVRNRELADVLQDVIQRYYSEPVLLPDEIMLPNEVRDRVLLERWLRQLSDSRISITIPQRGEKAHLIELVHRNAELQLEQRRLAKETRERVPTALTELKRLLHLSELPHRIVAFDVSTLLGEDKVASLVVFVDGVPSRSLYRHFKIRTVEGQDDFACMSEAVTRYFRRIIAEGDVRPDLVLIDGGKGQLAAAQQALADLGTSDQPVIGLAKRLEEVFVPSDSEPVNLPKTSSSLRLLQGIRDEAHRFAVTYHRTLRQKRSLRSILAEIDGIGPARGRLLIHHFGTMQQLRQASLAEIESVAGFPKTLAARVFDFFQNRARESSTA